MWPFKKRGSAPKSTEDQEEERQKLLLTCNNDNDLIKYIQLYTKRFRRLGNRYDRIYTICQIAILAASVSIPVVYTLIPSEAYPINLKITTSMLGFVSAVAVGILQIEQAYERMTLERLTKVSLEREIILFKNRAGPYSEKNKTKEKKDEATPEKDIETLSSDDLRKLFAQKIGEIIVNKFNRYYSIG